MHYTKPALTFEKITPYFIIKLLIIKGSFDLLVDGSIPSHPTIPASHGVQCRSGKHDKPA